MNSLSVIGIVVKAKSRHNRKIQAVTKFYTTTFVIAAAVGMMTAYGRTRPRHLSLDCTSSQSVAVPLLFCVRFLFC